MESQPFLADLSTSVLPRTCVSPGAGSGATSPACASGERVWPHLSRDLFLLLPPLLSAADWWRLRSRHVRLLCRGLGDGVCLREENETEEEEKEAGA